MIARKCDRCGKFYEYYEGSDGTMVPNGLKLVEWRPRDNEWHTYENYDLCPACMGKLRFFLEEKGDFE